MCPPREHNLGLGTGEQATAPAARERPKGTGRREAATTLTPELQPLRVSPNSELNLSLAGADNCPSLSSSHQFSPRPPGEGGPRSGPSEGFGGDGEFSLFNPPLEKLAQISEDDFRRLFAGSPIKRSKYHGWLRNLCVVIGNSGDRQFLPWLEHLIEHPDPIVREHAQWAREQLRNLGASGKPALDPKR